MEDDEEVGIGNNDEGVFLLPPFVRTATERRRLFRWTREAALRGPCLASGSTFLMARRKEELIFASLLLLNRIFFVLLLLLPFEEETMKGRNSNREQNSDRRIEVRLLVFRNVDIIVCGG